MRIIPALSLAGAVILVAGQAGFATDAVAVDAAVTEQAPRKHLWSGDWYFKVGAAGLIAPQFEGGKRYRFLAQPLIDIGRKGDAERFSSRDDDMSYALIDTDNFQFGPTGLLLFKEKAEIKGRHDAQFGAEVGAFVNYYPLDWMRFRTEVRHGIRTHNGIVGDVSLDAFYDVTPKIRISGGPRVTAASKDYFQNYFGVTDTESAASGLSAYKPGGGLKSVGVGGEINWKTTDHIDTSLFGSYNRLQGPAKDSSIVREMGSPNQYTVGVTATYRFDFSLD